MCISIFPLSRVSGQLLDHPKKRKRIMYNRFTLILFTFCTILSFHLFSFLLNGSSLPLFFSPSSSTVLFFIVVVASPSTATPCILTQSKPNIEWFNQLACCKGCCRWFKCLMEQEDSMKLKLLRSNLRISFMVTKLWSKHSITIHNSRISIVMCLYCTAVAAHHDFVLMMWMQKPPQPLFP